MYYILYQTANKINGKIYVGTHITENLDDKYLGSGDLLLAAVKKYGFANFKKEILCMFDTAEEMFEAEAKYVNLEFITRDDTYNIKEGGYGGWNHCNLISFEEMSKRGKKAANAFWMKVKNDPKLGEKRNKKVSESQKGENSIHYGSVGVYSTKENRSIKIQNNQLDEYLSNGWILGNNRKGENSQNYGICYIHSPIEERTIGVMRDQLDEYLSNGWIIGRYGKKCWIYSPSKQQETRIHIHLLDEYLSNGWIKGRKPRVTKE